MPGPRKTSAGTFGTSVRIMAHTLSEEEGGSEKKIFLGNVPPSKFKTATGKYEEEVITDLYSKASYRMVKHEQLVNPGPNKVVCTIEHCSDCSKHPSTTRHDEGKYSGNAEGVKDAIQAAYPFIEVHIKPTNSLKPETEAPARKDGQPGWVREKGAEQISERHPAGFTMPGEDAYRSERLGASRELLSYRLGACEVQLAIQPARAPVPKVHLLHSKLATRQWPSNGKIVKAIAELLPTEPHAVHVQCFDYKNDEREPREIPPGVKLEAAAGERKCTVDVPSGPDLEGVDVRLDVPICCKSIDFPGSDALCKSSLTIAPTQELGESHRVELNYKPRLALIVKPPPNPGYGVAAGTLNVVKGDFKATLPFGETELKLDVPEIPGEEPPAAAPFVVNVRLGDREETLFEKPEQLTLCKFGLTELPVAVPAIVAVTFQFQDDETNEYLDLALGQIKLEQLSGANDWLAQYCRALGGAKLTAGESAVSSFSFFLPANGKFKATAYFGERFDCEARFATTDGPQEPITIKLRPKSVRHVGRGTLEVDTLPKTMLESAAAKKVEKGLVDVAIVVDLTATMGVAAKEVAKILGAGGQLCEVHKVLEEEMALVDSLNVALVMFKDHADAIPGGQPNYGYKPMFPMSNNWAGLAAEAQKLECAGGGDNVYDAAGAAVSHVVGKSIFGGSKFAWRDKAARIMLLVTDAPPHGPAAEGFDASSDDPMKSGGPPDFTGDDAEFLPWPVLCKTLAAQGIAASGCLIEGATPDEYNNSAVLAMTEMTSKNGLGVYGRVKREGVGKLFAILVATVEVALDQQIIAETLSDGAYAELLAKLLTDAADGPDAATAAVLKACREIASKLEGEGYVVREAEIHPETEMVQVVRRPLSAAHVWEAAKAVLLHAHAVEHEGLKGAATAASEHLKKALLETPNSAIKAELQKALQAEEGSA